VRRWNVVAFGNIAKNVLMQFVIFNAILVLIENTVMIKEHRDKEEGLAIEVQ
jgi:hypothetical protein